MITSWDRGPSAMRKLSAMDGRLTVVRRAIT